MFRVLGNVWVKPCYRIAVRWRGTVGSLMDEWESRLRDVPVPESGLSVKYIMAHVLKLDSVNELPSRKSDTLRESQVVELERMCLCRMSRMPVQYIVGEWQFRDLTLTLRPPVFIPRPETEELVTLVIDRLQSVDVTDFRLLEIGCGSGAISLSLLKAFPKLEATALDQSKYACSLTMENARRLAIESRLKVVKGKVTGNGFPDPIIGERFSVLVSNPPYVLRQTLQSLEPEITVFEDLRALDGGKDGMDIIRHILNFSQFFLTRPGMIFLEVDPSHPYLIKKYLDEKPECNLQFTQTHLDFSRKERFVELQLKN